MFVYKLKLVITLKSIFFLSLLFIFFNIKLISQPRYNVLFIAIDDMNDYTGFMSGHPQTQTPNMDKLANQAVVFTNAFCSTAECNPSRTALLTGYRSKTTGFTNNFLPIIVREWRGVDEIGQDIAGYSHYQIPNMKIVKTLPQWFREHGYYSMGVGKIFHDHFGAKKVDKKYSWDEWEVVKGDELFGKLDLNGIYDGRILWEDWGPVDVPIDSTSDYKRAEWTAQKLKNYKNDKPFFLAVGFQKTS